MSLEEYEKALEEEEKGFQIIHKEIKKELEDRLERTLEKTTFRIEALESALIE